MTSSTASPQAGRRRVIERPRLTRMLDDTNARIILLTAPAGYGKTTLAQQWLRDRPSAWYRGTPASADVAALALGLAVAAAELVPGADDRLRERLRATNQPEEEVDVLAELLAEDLAAWPSDAWLVIDDYQYAIEAEPAEDFVDRLTELAPLRLFVTTRTRPKWATARRILYGDIFELERDALAMSEDEARKVLAIRGRHVPALVERSKGWPAVVGLAALTDSVRLPDAELPSALYDYFADEVYQRAEHSTRSALCELAVAPAVTYELAEHLFGVEMAPRILNEGLRLGVLSGDKPGPYSIHPLLRTFLESKLCEHGTQAVRDVVERVTTLLVQRRSWDEAFSVIQRFGDGSALADLVEASLDEMLAHGRLPTLERWLNYGQAKGIEAPVLDLARAEIAFRRGLHVRASSLASQAASGYDPAHPRLSRALLRAGQSAHLGAREDLALDLHKRAREVAQTEDDRVEAVTGQLSAALDLELEDVDRIRDDLESLEPQTPKAALRLVTGRLFMATRRGGLADAVDAAQPALELLPMVKDPLVRSGFQNIMSYALGVAGRYSEALERANEALREAERYRLNFALRHAYVTKAKAQLGLRRFGGARSLLQRAERIAREASDTHVEWFARAVHMRVSLAEGKPPNEDVQVLPNPNGLTKAMYGEFLATLSMVNACAGAVTRAEALADEAEAATASAEAGTLLLWARAIVEAQREAPEAERRASEAFLKTSATGCWDYFVCAYRGYPQLTRLVARNEKSRARLTEILTEAHDFALAKHLGLDGSFRERRGVSLTKREREVYELLLQGLSNREIAETLFITETTAKVHVRHILAKLGVRTRTEAASLSRRG